MDNKKLAMNIAYGLAALVVFSIPILMTWPRDEWMGFFGTLAVGVLLAAIIYLWRSKVAGKRRVYRKPLIFLTWLFALTVFAAIIGPPWLWAVVLAFSLGDIMLIALDWWFTREDHQTAHGMQR